MEKLYSLAFKKRAGIRILFIAIFGFLLSACHEEEGEVPLWQLSHQDSWYYAASIHADNRPEGTPMWARQTWDNITLLDKNAPMEIRPFWVMKSGGQRALTSDFYDEIRERTAAGYRVVYTLKGSTGPDDAADVAALRADVEMMASLDALPWGVGLWNELAFWGRYHDPGILGQANGR